LKITPLDRILLLLTALLAAYQVAIGIDGLENIPVIAYTIAFGILLVASLLLIILGFDVLDSPIVVIVSTILPLSLSLGLVWQYLPAWRMAYLTFTLVGFAAILLTRVWPLIRGPHPGPLPKMEEGEQALTRSLPNMGEGEQALTRPLPKMGEGRLPTIVLAIVHGVAGLVVFLLPTILAALGVTGAGFALVGLGGAMIGLVGLLLSFLKAGRPILPRETILRILPALFLLMTMAFVVGFALA
jgi:hypothetical protein